MKTALKKKKKQNRKFNREIELIKKNSQTEVLEFSNTVSNLKKSIKNFNFTWQNNQQKVISNWKIAYLKLSSQRSKNKIKEVKKAYGTFDS